MIKSVVRVHHWTPNYIDSLYFDNTDYLGLGYWYDDIVEVDQSIKAARAKAAETQG